MSFEHDQVILDIFCRFNVKAGDVLTKPNYLGQRIKYSDESQAPIDAAMARFVARGCATEEAFWFRLTDLGAKEVWG